MVKQTCANSSLRPDSTGSACTCPPKDKQAATREAEAVICMLASLIQKRDKRDLTTELDEGRMQEGTFTSDGPTRYM